MKILNTLQRFSNDYSGVYCSKRVFFIAIRVLLYGNHSIIYERPSFVALVGFGEGRPVAFRVCSKRSFDTEDTALLRKKTWGSVCLLYCTVLRVCQKLKRSKKRGA